MPNKKQKIRVENIYHTEIEVHDHGFLLTVHSTKKRVKLFFKDYQVDYIAEKLWKVIEHRERRLKQMKKSMRGEHDSEI